MLFQMMIDIGAATQPTCDLGYGRHKTWWGFPIVLAIVLSSLRRKFYVFQPIFELVERDPVTCDLLSLWVCEASVNYDPSKWFWFLWSHHASRSNPTKEYMMMLRIGPFAATMAARYIENGLWWAANLHKAWHTYQSSSRLVLCKMDWKTNYVWKDKSEYERKSKWQIYLWIDISGVRLQINKVS